MKKLILLLFTSSLLYSQDTIFYKKGFIKVNSITDAEYYNVINDNPQDKNQKIERIYYINGLLKQELVVTKVKRQILSSKSWYPDGSFHFEAKYKDGKKDGAFKSYYKSGKIKRLEEYKNGKRIKKFCYDELGNEIPFYEFEEKPKFPGGQDALSDFLRKNIHYRNPSSDPYHKYRVIVHFEIGIDGSISDIEIYKSANPYIDNLVLEALAKLPKWKPGKYDGELVPVKYSLPVSL